MEAASSGFPVFASPQILFGQKRKSSNAIVKVKNAIMSSACKQTIFLGKSLCCWRPIVFSEAYLIYMATLWYYEGNSSPRLVDWTMDENW